MGNVMLDEQLMARELDRVKARVFLGKNAAFLGPLMCGLTFVWDEETETAATDGVTLWWNPTWFLSLTPATRETVLLHELWHPARLHMIRGGSRDQEVFNIACDIVINNTLEDEGHSFVGVEWCWKDQQYAGMCEEQVYDLLMQEAKPKPPAGAWGDSGGGGDIVKPASEDTTAAAVANVMKAIQQANIGGKAGLVPGGVQESLTKFLTPIVPWEQLLYAFFTDLLDEDYTWARPNRRHCDIYLPSRFTDDGRLAHLIYYPDTSGSISNAYITRFNSEVKYIQETLKPAKLTVVQFDTCIQHERVFLEGDDFSEIVVYGRGGTSLVPVREHILKHEPTAAVIFSDLECNPMAPLDIDVPVIWAVVGRGGHTPTFGRVIHIRG
jgi:predicted metal-dependent peptidase